jgi:spermidine/putrescine transport system substrate-binding protein
MTRKEKPMAPTDQVRLSGPGRRLILDRRRFLTGSLGVAATAALAACSSATPTNAPSKTATPGKDGDTLNLYAWSGYFAPEVIDGFQKKHGITVTQTATASVPEMLQKLTAKQPFDLALANSTFLPDVTPTGLLQAIDTEKLENYGQVLETFRKPYFDPDGKYCIPYAMGGVGIAYRKSIFTNLTGSWTDIWNNVDTDPKHVYLFDDYQLTLAIALMHLGLNPNTDSQTDLDKAVDALRAIKPKLGGFGSTSTAESLTGGQATMSSSYTGDVLTAIRNMGPTGTDLTFEFAHEGQLFNADTMTIPAAANHPGNAMLFLDYVLSPENMAANVEYIGYAVPTTAGMAAYETLIKDTPFLKLDTDLMAKTDSWQHGLTATQRPLWNAAWLKVQG